MSSAFALLHGVSVGTVGSRVDVSVSADDTLSHTESAGQVVAGSLNTGWSAGVPARTLLDALLRHSGM